MNRTYSQDSDIASKIKAIYDSYPEKVLRTVKKILYLEKAKLHMSNPIGIYEEIIKIIKNEEK